MIDYIIMFSWKLACISNFYANSIGSWMHIVPPYNSVSLQIADFMYSGGNVNTPNLYLQKVCLELLEKCSFQNSHKILINLHKTYLLSLSTSAKSGKFCQKLTF
jgi:hypothetical protein